MATSQQYSLRWNNYLRHITYAFDSLRLNDDFVDVTLCCDGQKIKAHKMLLSACSGYFKEIFKENPHPHPVIIFKFIKFEDLNSIIEFMYQGEVNVHQEALQSFLQTAELLAVQGLTSEEKEKKEAPRTINEEQIIKTIPSTIRAVTENVTQSSQTIEIPAIITQHTAQQTQQQHATQQTTQQQQQTTTTVMKKRKITFSDDDEHIYATETVEYKEEPNIVKTTEINFLPATVKMDIPEYIDVSDTNQLHDTVTQSHQTSQESGGQTVTQYTSEYEILTESEIEESKYQNESADNTEITTIDMGRLISQPESTDSGGKDEKGNAIGQDLPNNKWTECQFCKMVITTVNLWRHIRTQHTPQPPRRCEQCQKNFKNKYSLREHIRISHEQKSSAHRHESP